MAGLPWRLYYEEDDDEDVDDEEQHFMGWKPNLLAINVVGQVGRGKL